MRTREDGIIRLLDLAESLKPEQASVATFDIAVDINVKLYGYIATADSDLDIFNAASPLIKLHRSTDETELVIRSLWSSVFTKDGITQPYEEGVALNHATDMAINYLVGLSAASLGGLFVWQRFDSAPIEITARRLSTNQHINVGLNLNPTNFSPNRVLHAGILQMGMENQMYWQGKQWSRKFYEVYQQGETLLTGSKPPLANYLWQAFLCFFRCLEYVSMVHILKKKDKTFNSNFFEQVIKKLNIRVRDNNGNDLALDVGRFFYKLRCTDAAHFGDKTDKANITPQDVLNLKGILDMITTAYTNQNLK